MSIVIRLFEIVGVLALAGAVALLAYDFACELIGGTSITDGKRTAESMGVGSIGFELGRRAAQAVRCGQNEQPSAGGGPRASRT
jgi:hypothetical protein